MEGLHLISTGKQSVDELVYKIQQIHPWIACLHIREKMWTDEQYKECINKLLTVHVPKEKIVINDRIHIAHMYDLPHVHLPSYHLYEKDNELTSQTKSYSIHSVEEAKRAEQLGARFVLAGHIFKTQSKKGLEPRGTPFLQDLKQAVNIPIIAIGGINIKRVNQVLQAGASGVAVLSDVLLSEDYKYKAEQYYKKLKGGMMMTLYINGNEVSVPDNLVTIEDLIEHFKFKSPVIIVEHNEKILKKADHKETKVSEGDKIEFVQFVGGG